MRNCPICNREIKNRVVVDGKVVNTQRRKYCYECSPFGSANNKALKCKEIAKEKEEAAARRKRKNKEGYRLYQKKARRERKKKLVEMLGGECERCGYKRSFRALDFHHKEDEEKTFNLSSLGYTCSWDKLVNEAKKCIVLCANCHREIGDDELVE